MPPLHWQPCLYAFQIPPPTFAFFLPRLFCRWGKQEKGKEERNRAAKSYSRGRDMSFYVWQQQATAVFMPGNGA
jgi:hypothetical protein